MSEPRKESAVHVVVQRTALESREQLHPMVQAAMSGGALDPSVVGQMMDLQERWEANENKKAYNRAMVAAKAELPTVIAKDRDGKNNRYASLAACTQAVTPILTRHGFSVSYPTTHAEDGSMVVTCRLTHSQGHSEDYALPGAPEMITNASGKSVRPAVQDMAATVTFLRRYTLTNALGFGTADMKDIDDDPDKIDPAANLKAFRGLAKHGKTRQDCEERVDKEMPRWNAADLEALRGWYQALEDEKSAAAPGEDG